MFSKIRYIAIFICCSLSLFACSSDDNTNKSENTNNTVYTSTPPTLEVIGVVGGKDGESVSLISLDHKNRYTTILSIPNLGNNYVNLKVGDRVQIVGEYTGKQNVRILTNSIVKVANPDKEKCEGIGSIWRPEGKAQIPTCIKTFSDAGNSCTSSAECEGDCVVTDSKAQAVCASNNSRFGCSSSIEDFKENGGVLCVD